MPWLLKDERDTGNAYITVCVETADEAEELFSLLKENNFLVSVRGANDSEWKDNWKQFAKIVKITDQLVVKPAWLDYMPEAGEKVLELDSGAAFGTGTHETTQACAKLICKYQSEHTKMLDIGTGSGILAIIGGMLGVKELVATDIDPVAVETAKINIEKNGYSDICDVRCGDLLDCIQDETFDIITANIIVDVLLILLKDVKQFLNPDGILILSGILEERCHEILESAEQNGFTLVEKLSENDWCGLAFRIA
ncbi:MAG: 50S ribosomal protein L11 methyltransferase, partial [Clostridia bacterium]|nr:50S ribosomal protein L11 methyltransferase [Clostridia bacterium]